MKPTSTTLKTTKDPHFGYLGVFNLDFTRHYETFFENFLNVPKGPPSIFLIFWNITDVRKSQNAKCSKTSARICPSRCIRTSEAFSQQGRLPLGDTFL